MFKSCCARPNKKVSKSKSKSEKMDTMSETNDTEMKEKSDIAETNTNIKDNPPALNSSKDEVNSEVTYNNKEQCDSQPTTEVSEPHKVVFEDSVEEAGIEDMLDRMQFKRDLSKKRFSVDYKRSRLDFKRFSVDCRRDSATLLELARLEQELARTNVDVRPGARRKSSGILKSTTSSSNGIAEQPTPIKPESDDDEVFEETAAPVNNAEGMQEPPATPVGRDELALRRHRFFSDLVCAARAAVEHRVRFDPLGPVVADSGEKMIYFSSTCMLKIFISTLISAY